MRIWLIGLGVAVGLMVTSWAVLVILARRLSPACCATWPRSSPTA